MRLTVCEFVDVDKNVENSETVSEDGIIESITGKPSDDDSCDQYETLLPNPPPRDLQPKLHFVGFVVLRPKSTAMVIAGQSVHLTTLFSWAGLNKRITSNSCTYFRL